MDEIITNLNYDYQIQCHFLRQALEKLSAHDRGLAIAWSNKLKTCGTSVQEATLRNDFLFYLIKFASNGKLQAPFIEVPPRGPLQAILALLPKDKNKRPEKVKPSNKCIKPFVAEKVDKAEFIAGKPIALCGAFCYLAVISRGPEGPPM